MDNSLLQTGWTKVNRRIEVQIGQPPVVKRLGERKKNEWEGGPRISQRRKEGCPGKKRESG